MSRIDIERCKAAMENLRVIGHPIGERRKTAIEEAIAQIAEDGASALTPDRIAIKNYASFGDQRCDCPPNRGPKHGTIVFSIERPRGTDGTLTSKHIYLLECVRDFGAKEVTERNGTKALNLCDVIDRLTQAEKEARSMRNGIDCCFVEVHAPELEGV